MPDPIIYAAETRGQIGHQWIYTRAGDVRTYFTPTNTRTPAQQAGRTIFCAVWAVIKAMSPTCRASVKSVSPQPPYWSAFLVKRASGPQFHYWSGYTNLWNELDNDARTAWTAAAASIGIDEAQAPGNNTTPIAPGHSMWIVSNVLYDLGLNHTTGAPGPTNAAAWSTYIG